MSSWATHLPAAPVLLPLAAAPLAVLLRSGRLAWLLAMLTSIGLLAASIGLVLATADGSQLSYAIGNWPPPFGIELVIDRLNAYVALLVACVALAAMLYARAGVAKELPEQVQHLFYSCLLLLLCGLFGMIVTGDAFNVFVFLEISSLATYALIAMGPDRRALTAAYRYLVMGTIGGTFVLIGIGFLYAATGTLNMADLATRLAPIRGSRTVLAAAAFITVGFGMKLALFPLHGWLPNAYSYAPSVVSALVAGTGTKVAVYMLVRFHISVFGTNFSYGRAPVADAALWLGIAGLLVCSFVAVRQQETKRLLAYSSVAQVGYILIGIGIGSSLGLTAAFAHLFNHAVIKAGLFLALGALMLGHSGYRIEKLAGLGRQLPWTGAAFTVCLMGLLGLPLTAGFVSKWYLLEAALEAGQPVVIGAVLLASLLGVIYCWRLVEVMYFQPAADGPAKEPWGMLIPAWLLAGATVFFGINTEWTVTLAQGIAESMVNIAPPAEALQ